MWIKSAAPIEKDDAMNVNKPGFDRKQHWEGVYRDKVASETSWYQLIPRLSLAMIRNTGFGPEAALIDVGGGASRLVDYLLDAGYKDLTVLDLSLAALEQASQRLGDRAARVKWVESDVTAFKADRPFDIWHDRAAFHFLTAAEDRRRYMNVLNAAVGPGGQAIIATFAPGGPEKCSGLDIIQYDAGKLGTELGPEFLLQEQQEEVHITPANREQLFCFFRFQRQG